MTIFSGMVARNGAKAIPASARQTLSDETSRFRGEKISELSGATFHFVKVDIGAFSSAGFNIDAENRIALLAGEPLLTDDSSGRTRHDDLKRLQQSLANRQSDVLASSSGTFCAAFFSPDSGELTLVADKFGVRPLYYWIGEQYVVFSTALRVIEKLANVPKRMDSKGVLETAAFGYPLAERTPYLDVHAIREAEVVTIGTHSVDRAHYWHWDRLAPYAGSTDDAAAVAHRAFTAAVKRRLGSDRAVAAFLSGGLDSRSIVANLRQLGTTVHTANCSRPGTQDVVFGPQIAQALDCIHEQVGPCHERPGDPYWKRGVMNWLRSIECSASPPERARLVWGGDGGSVGLGHVYLNQEMIDLMRQSLPERASETYLRHNRLGLPAGALNARSASALGLLPKQGIVAELARVHCADPGRNLHLFLMFNDQRRHLAEHFENIDIDRIEFQLPFFDARFMEVILSLPIDQCLRHHFYLAWLNCFDPVVVSTPWQAYPGHLPCPLPIPPGLEYQWSQQSGGAKLRAEQRKTAAAYLRARQECKRFPKEILSGMSLLMATTLTYCGIQNYSYALKFASVVLRYCEEYGDSMVAQ